MSKKHIEIEILDKELETVTTGGGVVVTQTAHLTNATLDWSNVGQSGCDASVDYLEYNLITAGGTPLISALKSCCFQTGGSGLTTQGPFPCTMYRETARPYSSSGDIIFPATAGGAAPGSNMVLNGDFDLNLDINGVTYTGFVHNAQWAAASNATAKKPWTDSIIAGHIATAPSATSISRNAYWYGASSYCSAYPTPYGSLTIAEPDIDYLNGDVTLGTNGGQFVGASCALAESGVTGMYQVIQGVTPGVTYELNVKFK